MRVILTKMRNGYGLKELVTSLILFHSPPSHYTFPFFHFPPVSFSFLFFYGVGSTYGGSGGLVIPPRVSEHIRRGSVILYLTYNCLAGSYFEGLGVPPVSRYGWTYFMKKSSCVCPRPLHRHNLKLIAKILREKEADDKCQRRKDSRVLIHRDNNRHKEMDAKSTVNTGGLVGRCRCRRVAPAGLRGI